MKAVVVKAQLWALVATGLLLPADNNNAAAAEQNQPTAPAVGDELISSAEVSAWIKKLQKN